MFSRYFRFVRSGLPSKCFSLEINQVEFLGLNATAYVVSLRTSTRHMPKKSRVARGTQQSHEPDPVKQGEGTNAAISLNKDGQICVRIVAKPGAKQSNITGETWTRKTKRLAPPAPVPTPCLSPTVSQRLSTVDLFLLLIFLHLNIFIFMPGHFI